MSETGVMTLTEFLLARIEEDEAGADAARAPGKWWVYSTGEKFNHKATAEHIARHDPARVLAECEAKRRIVEVCDDYEEPAPTVLRLLAAVYSDHPDYDPSWRPD